MKEKSFNEVCEQMDRIQNYYPNGLTNAEFAHSLLKRAYEITERYMDNIAFFQYWRDGHKAYISRDTEKALNEKFPHHIYAASKKILSQIKFERDNRVNYLIMRFPKIDDAAAARLWVNRGMWEDKHNAEWNAQKFEKAFNWYLYDKEHYFASELPRYI